MANTIRIFKQGELVRPIDDSLFYRIQEEITNTDLTNLYRKTGRPFMVISDPGFQRGTGLVWVVPQKTLSQFNVQNRFVYVDSEGYLREIMSTEILTVDAHNLRSQGKIVPEEIVQAVIERMSFNFKNEVYEAKQLKSIPIMNDPCPKAIILPSERDIVPEEIEVVEETPIVPEKETPPTPIDDEDPVFAISKKFYSLKEGITEVPTPPEAIMGTKEEIKKRHLTGKTRDKAKEDIMNGKNDAYIMRVYKVSAAVVRSLKKELADKVPKSDSIASDVKPDPITPEAAPVIIPEPEKRKMHMPSILHVPKSLRSEVEEAYTFCWDMINMPSTEFKEKYKDVKDVSKKVEDSEALLKDYNIQLPYYG